MAAVFASYRGERGHPQYHPAMMTALFLYAYSRGVRSSRKIETEPRLAAEVARCIEEAERTGAEEDARHDAAAARRGPRRPAPRSAVSLTTR